MSDSSSPSSRSDATAPAPTGAALSSQAAGDHRSPLGGVVRGPLVVGGVLMVMAMMTFFAVVVPRMAQGQRDAVLDVYGAMPSFRMVDQTGAEVTAEALEGHVVIANFIFTRCPTVCPLFTMKMQRLQKRTSAVRHRIKLISFSVDPEYDTPEVLAEYAAGYGADSARWRFLTGDGDDIERVANDGFKLALEVRGTLPNGAPDIVHAEHFVLLDSALRIRGYYDSNDPKRLERLVHDAYGLIKQADRAYPDPGAAGLEPQAE